MSVFYYIRKQDLNNQPLQHKLEAISKCDAYFLEADEITEDQALRRLMNEVKEQDWIIAPGLKTFGKSIKQLECFVGELEEKKIRLTLIEDNIDTEQFDFYQVFSSIVSMEYSFSVHQIKKGLKNAKKNGKVCGRPKVSEEKIQQIIDYYLKYGGSFQMIADKCEVSVGTVHKYIHQYEKK